MNAGAAIYIGGKADSIAEGIDTARRVIADGSALQKPGGLYPHLSVMYRGNGRT